jgi:octaprenyl-diphosphate synthase
MTHRAEPEPESDPSLEPEGIAETLADVRTKVERALEDVEAALRSAVEGSMVLEDLGTYLLEAGGKRLRPQLMLGCYLAAGGRDPQRPVQLAAAFELIHTASLVHDDIIDDPTLRRRRPAPHRRYGLSRALVAGDFLFAKAFELLSREDYRVASAVADAAVAMAEGEHLELMRSYDASVTEAQYEEVVEKKTASLMRASARVAATLADADEGTSASLEEYARRIGLAFQIVDDVLDLEPSAAVTGKPSGMDLREGRMTSVLLAGLDLLGGEERELVVRVLTAQSPPQADVDRALAYVRSTGAGGVALVKAHAHVEAAIAALPQTLPGPAREYLCGLAMEVANRRA